MVHRSPTTDSVRATEQFIDLTESHLIGVSSSPQNKSHKMNLTPPAFPQRPDAGGRFYSCTLKLEFPAIHNGITFSASEGVDEAFRIERSDWALAQDRATNEHDNPRPIQAGSRFGRRLAER
jgi:hypothetical protein